MVKRVLGILLTAALLVSFAIPMASAEEAAYTNDFASDAALEDFNAVGGEISIVDGQLKVSGGANAAAVLKTTKYKNFSLETDLTLESGGQVGIWFRIGDASNMEAGCYNAVFDFDVLGEKANDKIQAGYFPWNNDKTDWVNWLNVADKTEEGKTDTIRLKLTMIDGAVSVYTDDVYRATYNAYNLDEDKYEEGYIGLGGYNFTALFDNLKITALADDAAPVGVFDLEETPLYSFDFSEDLGDGWIVSEPEKIAAADGKLTFSGTTGDQYALFNTPITETVYCVEVTFVHTAGNIGLVNRAAVNDDTFSALAYTFDGGLTKLAEYPYKELTITKPFQVVPGSENVMKIYVNGNTTDVFINDVHVLGYNGGAAEGNLIGVLGWNAQCTFDDLKIYKVKGEAPPTPPTPSAPSTTSTPSTTTSTPSASKPATSSPATGEAPIAALAFAAAVIGFAGVMATRKKNRA